MNNRNNTKLKMRKDNSKILNIQSIKGRKINTKLNFNDNEDDSNIEQNSEIEANQRSISISKNVILINRLVLRKIKKKYQNKNFSSRENLTISPKKTNTKSMQSLLTKYAKMKKSSKIDRANIEETSNK